jgi:hypothetical protein
MCSDVTEKEEEAGLSGPAIQNVGMNYFFEGA